MPWDWVGNFDVVSTTFTILLRSFGSLVKPNYQQPNGSIFSTNALKPIMHYCQTKVSNLLLHSELQQLHSDLHNYAQVWKCENLNLLLLHVCKLIRAGSRNVNDTMRRSCSLHFLVKTSTGWLSFSLFPRLLYFPKKLLSIWLFLDVWTKIQCGAIIAASI